MKIFPVRERVIGDVVAEKAALHGEQTFVHFEDRRYSYRDLDELSNRIANGLKQMGVTKGTHVAFMLDNKPEIIFIFFALAKLGAVAAPLNTAAKGDLLAYYLTQSDSELVIADAALVDRIATVRARTPKLRHIIALVEAKAPAVNFGDSGLPHSDYNMPEATAESWRNLWFHAGDRGYLDADGYLYFVDRKKDAIRRRGENVSSFEVEQIILMCPQVLEVAAFPVASEHSEDEVMVSVVRREGQRLFELELTQHCKENMAYYMVPGFIEFVAELLETMTEKVEKFKLRAGAEPRLTALWDREKAGVVVER